MPRKPSSPCERIHVHLYEGDCERLDTLFFGTGVTRSHVIRQIVRIFINNAENQAQLKAKTVEISHDLVSNIARDIASRE